MTQSGVRVFVALYPASCDAVPRDVFSAVTGREAHALPFASFHRRGVAASHRHREGIGAPEPGIDLRLSPATATPSVQHIAQSRFAPRVTHPAVNMMCRWAVLWAQTVSLWLVVPAVIIVLPAKVADRGRLPR